MTHKRFIAALTLVLAVIGSLGDGMAEDVVIDSVKIDWYRVKTITGDTTLCIWVTSKTNAEYAVEAESLTVINNVLIECANQANWPSSGGVLQEGEK